MRLLERQLRRCHLAKATGKAMAVGPDGRYTGALEVSREAPREAWCSYSQRGGYASREWFGETADYDGVMLFDDPEFEVDESTLVWLDAPPEGPHDHTVTRVARTPAYTAVAVRRCKGA